MGDFINIQQEEIKILENIYLNDFQLLKSSYPFKFEIMIKPYISAYDAVSQNDYNILVEIDFVKSYPEKNPRVELRPISNITQDNVAQIEDYIDQINRKKIPGQGNIYDIIEGIREWIYIHLICAVIDEKKEEEYIHRPQYATFTPVTVQNFLTWKAAFEQELKLIKQQQPNFKDDEERNTKLTGRQWFAQKQEGVDDIKETDVGVEDALEHLGDYDDDENDENDEDENENDDDDENEQDYNRK